MFGYNEIWVLIECCCYYYYYMQEIFFFLIFFFLLQIYTKCRDRAERERVEKRSKKLCIFIITLWLLNCFNGKFSLQLFVFDNIEKFDILFYP